MNCFHVISKLYCTRKLTVVIEWPGDISLDTLFLLIIDESTSRSVAIFLQPSIGHFHSSLDFSPNNKKYTVNIYGLVTMETNRGRFYRHKCCSKNELTDVTDTHSPEVVILFQITTCRCTSFPFKENPETPLKLQTVRKPPSTYTVIADTKTRKVYTYIIFVRQKKDIYILTITKEMLRLTLPIDLVPGTWTEVLVIRGLQEDNGYNRYMMCSTSCRALTSFKTYMSMGDYRILIQLAEVYINRLKTKTFQPIQYLYRNKSGQYFHDILASTSGEMTPYLKDFNGDQGSVINGFIHGLFFSTYLGPTSKPPPISFYGPIRFHLQANLIFTDKCNIYFADFYCHYKQHYVTIVLTPQGTDGDTFCRQHLILLNIFNNPFVKIVQVADNQRVVVVTKAVIVEIFYTESINIRNFLQKGYGFISKAVCMGRGKTKPEGIPKKQDCIICNSPKETI